MEVKTLDEAIKLLKTIVQNSNIPGQPHVDLGLVDADKKYIYEEALMITKQAVIQEEISESELKSRLGLI